MAMLETKTGIKKEQEQATRGGRFFVNHGTVGGRLVDALVQAKDEHINWLVLDRIAKCQAFITRVGLEELDQEERDIHYDHLSVVRRCAEKVSQVLEKHLPAWPFLVIGEGSYSIITDVHSPDRNGRWLLRASDNTWVSFREPRGLTGDDEFAAARFQDQKMFIEDVVAATEPHVT